MKPKSTFCEEKVTPTILDREVHPVNEPFIDWTKEHFGEWRVQGQPAMRQNYAQAVENYNILLSGPNTDIARGRKFPIEMVVDNLGTARDPLHVVAQKNAQMDRLPRIYLGY
jgi:hypothetical protein